MDTEQSGEEGPWGGHRINNSEFAYCKHPGLRTTGGKRDRAKEWGKGRMRQSSEEVLNEIVLGDSPGFCAQEGGRELNVPRDRATERE